MSYARRVRQAAWDRRTLVRGRHALTSSVKPSRWNVQPGLVAPEWRWAWEGLSLAVGCGPRRDAVSGELFHPYDNAVVSTTPRGRALYTDGADDHWYKNSIGPVPTSYPFSVLGIIRIEAFPHDWPCLLHVGRQGDGGYQIGMKPSGGVDSAYFYAASSGDLIQWGDPNLVTGEWLAFSHVHENANSHRVYIRSIETGGLIDESTATSTVSLVEPSDRKLKIGASNDGDTDYWDEFNGDTAALYVWDYALGDDQLDRFVTDPFGPFRRAQVQGVRQEGTLHTSRHPVG